MAGTNFTQKMSTVAADLKQQIYLENRLLEMIKLEREQFVFHTLGKAYQINANEGTTIVRMRRYLALPQFADGHALTEGVIPTQPLKIEGVTVSATVNQFGAYMQLTDVLDMVNLDNIKQIYQPELARHAAELIERDVISKLESEASIYFVGNVANASALAVAGTSAGTYAAGYTDRKGMLQMKDLRKVALYMKNQLRGGHVKFGGKPVVVVHPNVMADLLDDVDLKNRLLDPGQENAPIKIGTLQNYQFYGIFVQETLIAPVKDLKNVPGIANKTFAAKDVNILDGAGALGDVVYNVATGVTGYYKCVTAGAAGTAVWAAISPSKVYVSFMLGKDPYIVTSLAGGSVKFMSTGFEATKDDPLGQIATVGYKLWTGAKVIDPFAITAIYSFSLFDTADLNIDTDNADADLLTDEVQAISNAKDAATQTAKSNYTV